MAGKGNITGTLWKGKFYIVLALALVAMIIFGTYYFLDARNLSSRLGQKEADYDALNGIYQKLTGDHNALVSSDNDLKIRYADVTDRYNNLSVHDQELQSTYNSLKSTYDGLNSSVTRMQETNGAVFAMRHDFYEGGPSNDRKNYLEITVYNVGNKKADKITVKGQIVNADNTTSTSEQTFTNVEALDKRHVKWEYSTATHLNSVWYET